MWTLDSVDPPDVALRFRLLPGALKTMGRAPRADLIVDAPLVSRLHCRFVVGDGGALAIEDLGSTNGVFVNGERVTSSPLSSGDTVTVGRVRFSVSRVE